MSEEQPVAGGKTIEFGSLGKPTAEQVGTIWNGMPEPSSRAVAEKMTRLGWKVSPSTVARYRLDQFVTQPRGKKSKVASNNGHSPEIDARAKIVNAAKEIDKLAAMHDSPELAAVKEALAKAAPEEIGSNFNDLMAKPILQLKDQFSKTTMAAGIMLAEAVILRRVALSLMPKEVGSFLNDMSQVADNLKLTGDEANKDGDSPGDNAKLINGVPVENGPSTTALSSKIAQFRRAHERASA